jgi:hypothetical protein
VNFVGMTADVIDQMANVTASYVYAAGGTADDIPGIFENGYRAFDLGGVAVESNQPELSVKTSDLTSPARGDTVEIDDITYTVRDIRPDNEGLTVLVLTEPS